MTKYPLFGEDSSPAYTSRVLSLIITAAFCLIFLLCTIFVKPFNRKKEYKTVQIVLNDSPKQTQKKAEQSAAAAPSPAPAAENSAPEKIVESAPEPVPEPAPVQETKPVQTAPAPVVQKKVEAPKQTAAKKTEAPKTKTVSDTAKKPAAKTTPAPAPAVQNYAVDVEDAFEQQLQKKPKQEFDWSQFDDSASEAATEKAQKVVNSTPVQSGFSGTAGTAANNAQSSTKSSTSSDAGKTVSKTSSGTNKALSEIAKAEGVSQTDTSGTSSKAVQTGKSSSDSDIKWTGGAARKLIMPKKPEINFSEASQNLLGSYKEINISFDVDKSGYVNRNTIKTIPAVPQTVLTEIADQIDGWWFEAGDSTATASLICNIKRK